MSDPYPIFILPPNAPDADEPMGAKEKFWFEHTDGNKWLFKFNRKAHENDWSERIACEIARLLGLPHGHVELATFENRSGVMCRDFTGRGKMPLEHGNELLVALVDPAYPKKQNYKVTGHTVERVLGILTQPWIGPPDGFSPVTGIATAAEWFAGYLLLDALIGNTDRHHANWAVMAPAHYASVTVRREQVRLAPTFDHASCLGFSMGDAERVDRMTPGRNRSVESFVDRAESKLYLEVNAKKPLSPLQAFAEATRQSRATRKAWVDRAAQISDDAFAEVIEAVPEHRMSRPARDFAMALLRLNRRRIVVLESA